jgi:hypothetical protein
MTDRDELAMPDARVNALTEVTCDHAAPYRFAVRVSANGAKTFRKLGTGASKDVVATWCERCGMISVGPRDTRYFPRARVFEDLTDRKDHT